MILNLAPRDFSDQRNVPPFTRTLFIHSVNPRFDVSLLHQRNQNEIQVTLLKFNLFFQNGR